jgi:hypothetical protein
MRRAWVAVITVVLAGCGPGRQPCVPADRMPVTRPDTAGGRYRTPVVRPGPDAAADSGMERDVRPPCLEPAAA